MSDSEEETRQEERSESPVRDTKQTAAGIRAHREKILHNFGHFEQLIVQIRSLLLFDKPKNIAVSVGLILVYNFFLYEFFEYAESLGPITGTAVAAMIAFSVFFLVNKFNVDVTKYAPKAEANRFKLGSDKTADVGMDDLFDQVAEGVEKLDSFRQELHARIYPDGKLHPKAFGAGMVLLLIVAIMGQLFSTYFCVWFSTHVLIFLPVFFEKGLHKPIHAKLEPHLGKITQVIDQHIPKKTN